MTEKVRDQILAIRKTGRTNMFDVPMVQYIANEMRFYELVVFLEEHRGEYVHFLIAMAVSPFSLTTAPRLRTE